MASTKTCTCCFLNRISLLRGPSQNSRDLSTGTDFTSTETCQHSCQNKICSPPKTHSESPFSTQINGSNNGTLDCRKQSLGLMIPERLTDKVKPPQSSETLGRKENNSLATSYYTLADKIGSVLKKEIKYIEECMPDCPDEVCGLESERLEQLINFMKQSNLKEDEIIVQSEIKAMVDVDEKQNIKRNDVHASGDHEYSTNCNLTKLNIVFNSGLTMNDSNENQLNSEKCVLYFNEEPVKLSTPLKPLPHDELDRNLITAYNTENKDSITCLFSSENKVQCSSNSTVGSNSSSASIKPSSTYMTASCHSEGLNTKLTSTGTIKTSRFQSVQK